MYELLITEKPQSAIKIAEALADKKVKKSLYNSVPYYELTHKGKKIIVGCAVGHLYGLKEKDKSGWTYPTFSYEWKPISAKYTKDFIDCFKRLAKDAEEFTVSTDKDVEGSLIGFNILRFICNKKDGHRMEFSTLTKPDLVESYENKLKHIDTQEVIAGETRHELDWIYGVNVSRALTLSVKNAGLFKILSSGRVQSPTLDLLAKREKERQKFKPVPFWQLFITLKTRPELTAIHKKNKFLKESEAKKILEKCKNKNILLKNFEKSEYELEAPPAFNLTTLQTEAYRLFGYSPKQTLDIAQSLYLLAHISYPRTSSEKLDPKIGYKKILNSLKDFKHLVEKLPKKLEPKPGKKTDPAHTAIYPTTDTPRLSKLNNQQKNIYELIVKRFISAFAPSATRETLKTEFEVNKELFIARGSRTITKGWLSIYPISFKEVKLPSLVRGEIYSVKSLNIKKDETKPPQRYSQGSIISEMEKRGLGTKATRSQILQTLYDRHYLKDKAIKVTKLGIVVAETLEKYTPELTSEELTKHFENEMEKILEKKKKKETIIAEAKKILKKTLTEFKKKEKEVGSYLVKAVKETQDQMNTIGECPVCKKGRLRILWSKKSKKRFIACSNYPKCKTTFSLPQRGFIKPLEEKCKECGYPQVLVIRKEKRPWKLCIKHECPSKKNWK